MLYCIASFSQENYKTVNYDDSVKFFNRVNVYHVENFVQVTSSIVPKNVILMIGDGMGVSQVSAALYANEGHLYLENFKFCGFSQTQSADNFITDSSAGGTAISCGKRTNNGHVGVGPQKEKLKTILEYAEDKGLQTGLVSTSAITHATPASFISHQESRLSYEDIALDFLKTDIDLFIGGGYAHFANRSDNKNLIDSLILKGYQVYTNFDSISNFSSEKIACLTAYEHCGRLEERKDLLPRSTHKAIDFLDSKDKGFFLMVEGSQIDWGGHHNDTKYVVEETLDFDQTIGEALKFAHSNGETLIIVTADHETGGFALIDGNYECDTLRGGFASPNHTATMVPVFAYGPGAEHFTGIMKNTDIFERIFELLIK